MIEIKHRYSGAVLYSGGHRSMKTAAEAAVKAGVSLAYADLRSADLSGANLYSADLRSADLRRAHLSGADLSGADLRSADPYSADLSGANLYSADLRGADLRCADLRSAYLYSADLRGVDLSGVDLSGADLSSANLPERFVDSLAFKRTRILPDEGDVIGWKKCRGNVLVKLRVPSEAKRSHALGRKCRAEYVEVLEVIGSDVAYSEHDDGHTVYRPGEIVKSDRFEDDWRIECAPGIHFFITRIEAENY